MNQVDGSGWPAEDLLHCDCPTLPPRVRRLWEDAEPATMAAPISIYLDYVAQNLVFHSIVRPILLCDMV